MRLYKMLFIFIAFMAAESYGQGEEKDLGGHRRWDAGANEVIENRCLVCHNRQRIDQAVSERKEMEKIQKAMEEKGAKLSEQESKVLGHFWQQNPFKEK